MASRADRLLRLVQLLRRHRTPVTARTLAEALETSERSIYRDVATLRGQGAAIEGEAGVGYLLRPGFLLPPLMFTDEELEALVLGLRLAARHADPELGQAAGEVVAKLRAVVPKGLRARIDETALLAGTGPDRPRETVGLAEVRRAIRAGHRARITYLDDRGSRTERTVWPLGVAFFERRRLLIAWCELRQGFRAFRTDRLVQWRTTAEPIPRPKASLLAEWRALPDVPKALGRQLDS